MNLLFFDLDESKIAEYKKAFDGFENTNTTINFVSSDVRDLIKTYNVQVAVSPANCLGFMDGGIDIFYMQMFPGIQLRVQKRIESFGITTSLGRHILPVGSAMLVSTGSNECKLLACVPTMFLPEDIRNTQNVYWAIRGLLKLIDSSRPPGLTAIPCMGTGVGKMTASQSAHQVRQAFDDHFAEENPSSQLQSKHAYVLSKMACVQPITYANTEIQPETMQRVIEGT